MLLFAETDTLLFVGPLLFRKDTQHVHVHNLLYDSGMPKTDTGCSYFETLNIRVCKLRRNRRSCVVSVPSATDGQLLSMEQHLWF